MAMAGAGRARVSAAGPRCSEGRKGHGQPPVPRRWGWSVGLWEEPALASPPAAPAAQKATPRQAHVAPSESRAVHPLLLTERDVGPPRLDSRGPPGKVRGTLVVDSRAASQTDSPKPGGNLCFPDKV